MLKSGKKLIAKTKKMDEVQNDLSQKIDNLQDSISRFANLNTMQEKENSPSQPYQHSKGIHVVEAQKGESSMVKEVKTVISNKYYFLHVGPLEFIHHKSISHQRGSLHGL